MMAMQSSTTHCVAALAGAGGSWPELARSMRPLPVFDGPVHAEANGEHAQSRWTGTRRSRGAVAVGAPTGGRHLATLRRAGRVERRGGVDVRFLQVIVESDSGVRPDSATTHRSALPRRSRAVSSSGSSGVADAAASSL